VIQREELQQYRQLTKLFIDSHQQSSIPILCSRNRDFDQANSVRVTVHLTAHLIEFDN